MGNTGSNLADGSQPGFAHQFVFDLFQLGLDAHTLHPLAGLDRALDLRPSRLPYVALLCGLLGTLGGLALQWAAAGADPQPLGGKPAFAWIAALPVALEHRVDRRQHRSCADGIAGQSKQAIIGIQESLVRHNARENAACRGRHQGRQLGRSGRSGDVRGGVA